MFAECLDDHVIKPEISTHSGMDHVEDAQQVGGGDYLARG
jgi:hypothetical protein